MNKHVVYRPKFTRNFKQRVNTELLREMYRSSFKQFLQDNTSPELDDHELESPMKGLRSFKIEDDLIITYKETKDKFIFYDIGSHDEVYDKPGRIS